MIRSFLARWLLVGALSFGIGTGPALASGLGVTLYDQRDNALGTATNPLVTTGGGQSSLPPNAAQETGGNLAAILARTPPLTPGGQTPVADPNNTAYSAAGATFATGATVTPGRAIYLNCSASGSVTMSLSGGGSLAYPVTAGANVLPFAVTAVSADTASCTHQNIN